VLRKGAPHNRSQVPRLTARVAIPDRVAGLDAGDCGTAYDITVEKVTMSEMEMLAHRSVSPLAYALRVAANALSVGEIIAHLRPGLPPAATPRWPPDAFALALAILRHADAYSAVVSSWPPGRRRGAAAAVRWEHGIRTDAAEWRRAAGRRGAPPKRVQAWWQTVAGRLQLPLSAVRADAAAREALLQIVAVADEASHRAGSWDAGLTADRFHETLLELLIEHGSLAEKVEPSRAVVLPKSHTPQRGITARSLTHHLALHEPRDVLPRWFAFPYGIRSPCALNVLVLPWPERVVPRDFQATRGRLLNMPESGHGMSGGYGFFTYAPRSQPATVRSVRDALARARSVAGDIDAIVFPELALAPGQAESLCRALGVIVIGGEGRSAANRKDGLNRPRRGSGLVGPHGDEPGDGLPEPSPGKGHLARGRALEGPTLGSRSDRSAGWVRRRRAVVDARADARANGRWPGRRVGFGLHSTQRRSPG
jgi:hypothetical protein